MPSTTDTKISATNLFGRESSTGKLASIVRSNKKGIAINARKITLLKNITKEQQKQDAGDTVGDKLPGGGGGLKGILGSIASTMDGILKTLTDQNKLDIKAANDARKADEKKKRSLGESALEATKNALVSAGEKILAPVKNIFSKIFDFIKVIFLGRIAMRLWDWFSDPANTEKVKSLFRFIKDWWPVIVAGIMAVIGPGVTFTVGAIALLGWATVKIVDAVKSIFGFGKKIDKELQTGAAQSEKDMANARDGIDKQLEDQVNDAQKDKPQVDPIQTPDPDAQQIPAKEMAKGGEVPGKGDKDTVPAMLTPGEFVMSKDAVKQWGVGTLAGMNAAGGGSNSATMSGDGVMGFRGGGLVPGDDKKEEKKKPQGLMRAAAGYADFLTGGIFDFDKRGGGLAGMFGGGGGGGNDFAKDMIKKHEGMRLQAYKDSKGFLTVGYGHLIDDGSPGDIKNLKEGDTITEERAHQLFEQDYKEHADAAKKIPGYGKADEKQQAALIDLTFNMGPDWHTDFPKFTAAFKAGNYELAGAELENSKWYGDVARRAPTIVSLIKGKGVPEGSYLGGGSGGGAPGAGGSSGGRYGGSSSTPANVSAPPPVSSIGPPPKSSTVAYANQQQQQQEEKPFIPSGAPQLPGFEADTMNSLAKIRTLGITV